MNLTNMPISFHQHSTIHHHHNHSAPSPDSSGLFYYLDQYWTDVADPRTRDFPLVPGGLWRMLILTSCYLLTVKRLIPYLMANRRPFELKWPMIIYNAAMVVINAYFFYELVVGIDYGRRLLDFDYPSREDRSARTLRELNLAWWGWMSRFADWLDTVFFALRKKHQQISFLHVYHHCAVPLLGWLSMKLNPLAPIIGLFGLWNTAIHVLMYSYYSLAALGPTVRRYLWWKKYITQLQMAQFVACGLYGIVLFNLQTGYPMVWFWVAVGQNPIFLYMFYDFYRQSYDHGKKLEDKKLLNNNKNDQIIEKKSQ